MYCTFADTKHFSSLPYGCVVVNNTLTQSASFTSYSKEGFDDSKQIELGNFVSEIHQNGAKILLSNSDPKNADKNDNFFDDLYKDFDIKRVSANRMINSNSEGRGAITEIMVACF